MIITIQDVLNTDDLQTIMGVVPQLAYEDGRATAGWAAREVKDNEQASPGRALDALRCMISQRILANEVFALAVRPKALTPLIISRYGAGRRYGAHVDDALMNGMRTDVSFTLFLVDPDAYDGGELVIETTSGEESFKLPAGSMVTYPSTTLHRVEPVIRGERCAVVGWARSYVRSPEKRELLFDLDRARRALHEREGPSTEFSLLSKTHANLLRMWAED
ncbi:Fe2+-dependent dioxygenase [Alsobacter sp. SYSU M60028]|uniref:Fe2+-dependent dioxygenase n=1 Tax=Alsobacter ponti TaxID=2962936 RepID=A0ABT1L7H2_9HYPH|nr:Fe2+-dependent dioxygenase [Alsobacter ponti]MCP8937372.1 Fe2+-dependent dioxygenase [Alsobacter ponti]